MIFSRVGKTVTQGNGLISTGKFLHEKKKTKYPTIGKKGKKNCLVAGMNNVVVIADERELRRDRRDPLIPVGVSQRAIEIGWV